MVELKVRYISKEIDKLRYIDGVSDWIDLRSAEDVSLKAGESRLIRLGIAVRYLETRGNGKLTLAL